MIQKTYLLKDNKKILVSVIAIVFSIFLIIFLFYQKYNYDYFIQRIQDNSGLQISKKGNFKIDLFPKIHFTIDNLELYSNTEKFSFLSREILLSVMQGYLNWTKKNFTIYSPSTVVNGIPLRDVRVAGNYKNSNIKINNFSTEINEGDLSLKGSITINETNKFYLDGNFNNISLTTILNQSQQIDWNRVNIKLKSNFHIETNGKNHIELINNLNANFPITGMFYINSTPEERFGTALLNVLTEKIPELHGISRSLDFILTRYADIPSEIEGIIIIDKGVLKTNNLFILNKNAKMKLDLFYDIIDDEIDGKLYFYNNGEVFLETKLKGSINNPQILVGGKNFIQKENKEPLEDIKKIIEEGITNIFQKLLDAQ